jgi:glycosyltransferase involved in cell wall biosynthesis
MRLLVVSYVFPPFNCIGGVRVGKTAKYLTAHGHDVRVLTSADQPFPRTLDLEVPGERVLYSRYLNVRKPVEVALGDGARAAAMSASKGAAAGGGALRKGVGFFLRTFVYFPDANVGWLAYAARDASALLRGWRPDLILASSPPPTGLLVARRLSKRLGVPWVADLRDLWVDHQYYDHPRWRRAVEERLERRVLSTAAGFVTVSGPLAERLEEKYRKPTAVVLNGFDPGDYPPRAAARAADRRLTILYTGVVYPGRQDPSPLFDALRRMGGLADEVKVVFRGSFLGTVPELAARYGVERLVEVGPPVPYRESLRMQSEADLLLLLLWTDAAQRGVYTGKLFEYVGARRPILAVGAGADVAAEFILSRGAGSVSDDPDEIAALLRRLVEQKRREGALPPTPERAAAGVTREEQVRLLENFLSGLLRRAAESRGASRAANR